MGISDDVVEGLDDVAGLSDEVTDGIKSIDNLSGVGDDIARSTDDIAGLSDELADIADDIGRQTEILDDIGRTTDDITSKLDEITENTDGWVDDFDSVIDGSPCKIAKGSSSNILAKLKNIIIPTAHAASPCDFVSGMLDSADESLEYTNTIDDIDGYGFKTDGRPTPRQSELDAEAIFTDEGFKPQVSYKGDGEVKYGTKGSTRPDMYNELTNTSIEVKNYKLNNQSGLNRLKSNINKQFNQRVVEFPDGLNQKYVIDVRGQNPFQSLDEIQKYLFDNTPIGSIDDIIFMQ